MREQSYCFAMPLMQMCTDVPVHTFIPTSAGVQVSVARLQNVSPPALAQTPPSVAQSKYDSE